MFNKKIMTSETMTLVLKKLRCEIVDLKQKGVKTNTPIQSDERENQNEQKMELRISNLYTMFNVPQPEKNKYVLDVRSYQIVQSFIVI